MDIKQIFTSKDESYYPIETKWTYKNYLQATVSLTVPQKQNGHITNIYKQL